jgi:hypothetical protein
MSADDKAYLTQVVSARTGLPQTEAEKRVSGAFEEAQQSADSTRKAMAHLSLWLFVALLRWSILRELCWDDRRQATRPRDCLGVPRLCRNFEEYRLSKEITHAFHNTFVAWSAHPDRHFDRALQSLEEATHSTKTCSVMVVGEPFIQRIICFRHLTPWKDSLKG